jgi:GTP cyclohydrolase II
MMTALPSRSHVADLSSGSLSARISPLPDPETLRLRQVHRAIADLRRGTPVILSGATKLIVLAAETAGGAGLEDIAALASGPACLLLAQGRAEAVTGTTAPLVAVAAPKSLLAPAFLRSLADPTAEQMLGTRPKTAPVPDLGPAAIQLVKLGRLLPAALVAPIKTLDAAHLRDLLVVEAADVLAYKSVSASSLVRVAEASVPLEDAPDARIIAFRSPDGGIEHLAILVGRPEAAEAPLVRLHSECFTGDLLGSLRCDCGAQLRGAIARMAADGAGVLLYLAQEGRGIGLANKLRAYAMQDRGLDTIDANRALGWDADERNFMVAATMLEELGIPSVRLMTNNPDKVAAMTSCGINVQRREEHAFAPNGVNDHYLDTKMRRFGHYLG